MKITQRQLRRIIKEEVRRLHEAADPQALYDEMNSLFSQYGPYLGKIEDLGAEKYEKLVSLRDSAKDYNEFFFAVKAPSWSSSRNRETGTHYDKPTEFNLSPNLAHWFYNLKSDHPAFREIESAGKRHAELKAMFKNVKGSTEGDHVYGRKRTNVVHTPTGEVVSSTTDRQGSLGGT